MYLTIINIILSRKYFNILKSESHKSKKPTILYKYFTIQIGFFHITAIRIWGGMHNFHKNNVQNDVKKPWQFLDWPSDPPQSNFCSIVFIF